MFASGARLLLAGEVAGEARLLRDRGHEVVVLGAGVSAEQATAVAVQEDVGLVAVTDPQLGAAVAELLGDEAVVFWVTSETRPSSPPEPRD